jgi:hypothetical protein
MWSEEFRSSQLFRRQLVCERQRVSDELETAPGFLTDAPNISGAGTGKGLLVKACCVVASGIRPHAFTSGHDAAEFDKRLTAALVEARPCVFLDNFNAKELKSDILASALTENPAMVRVFGKTKNVPLFTTTFIAITGNGVQIAEDTARRMLVSRLDARMENPEQRREVKAADLHDAVKVLLDPKAVVVDGKLKASREQSVVVTAAQGNANWRILARGSPGHVPQQADRDLSAPRRLGAIRKFWSARRKRGIGQRQLPDDHERRCGLHDCMTYMIFHSLRARLFLSCFFIWGERQYKIMQIMQSCRLTGRWRSGSRSERPTVRAAVPQTFECQ